MNKKRKCFYKVAFYVLLFILYSKTYGADITGRLINLKSRAVSAYYYDNIDGFCNMLYNPSKINFINNSFHISLKNKHSGFCIIELPNLRVPVYVNPTDSIHLNLYYSSNPIKTSNSIDSLIFYGNNKFGNNLYNVYEREILWKQVFYTNNIFLVRNHNDVKSLFKDVSFLIDSLLNPFTKAYQTRLIEKEYFLTIKADITAKVLLNTVNLLKIMTASASYNLNHVKKDTSLQEVARLNSSLLTRKSIDSLKKLFYSTYSPLDSGFQSSWLGVNYIQDYYQNSWIDFMNINFYDSNFNNLIKDNRYFGFMHGRTQEIAWARNLYWYIEDEQNFPAVKREYYMFKRYHPASKLIKFLDQKIINREKEWKKSQNDMDTALLTDIHFLRLNSDSTLTQIIHHYFPVKNVFIDLWATWCHPCVEQLAFEKELQAYLYSKGVETLYISIDDETNEETWKSMVKRKHLKGYHILSSPELLKNIQDVLYNKETISIPRYLLISKAGTIINTDLPRPSDMENLKNTINKLIN